MPIPPDIRFAATGRNGANSSRMKSGSKRETLLKVRNPAPLRNDGKNANIPNGGTRNLGQDLGQAPLQAGGCNEGKRKSAPRALVMAVISGLWSCCSTA